MSKKILVVDDESDIRHFTARFFRKHAIEVITASSGEKAIELTEKENPELILLDINMDGLDGIGVLSRIREKNKEIPIVMVTGKKPEEDQACKRCQELGISGYIHKPLELNELERVVLSLVR